VELKDASQVRFSMDDLEPFSSIDELMRELDGESQSRILPRIRRPIIRGAKILTALLGFVIVTGLAFAAVVLFTHTAPTVTVPAQAITTTCTNLYTWSTLLAQGLPGFAVFTCKGTVAITAGGSSGTVTATPSTLTLGSWSGVFVYQNNSQPVTACIGTQLTQGTAVTFNAGQPFNYCASTTSAPATLTGFSVTWSQ
jgi:hypothetical protein